MLSTRSPPPSEPVLDRPLVGSGPSHHRFDGLVGVTAAQPVNAAAIAAG